MEQLQEASTDIIIVANKLLFKNDVVDDIDQYLNRRCDVTDLQPMSIIQRMVYTCGLFEKSNNHDAFSILSKYSLGMTMFVHMLTLLMENMYLLTF